MVICIVNNLKKLAKLTCTERYRQSSLQTEVYKKEKMKGTFELRVVVKNVFCTKNSNLKLYRAIF